MGIIDLLVYLIILAIVGGILYWILSLLPLPQPFKQIVLVCAALIFLLILLGALFGGIPLPHLAR